MDIRRIVPIRCDWKAKFVVLLAVASRNVLFDLRYSFFSVKIQDSGATPVRRASLFLDVCYSISQNCVVS